MAPKRPVNQGKLDISLLGCWGASEDEIYIHSGCKALLPGPSVGDAGKFGELAVRGSTLVTLIHCQGGKLQLAPDPNSSAHTSTMLCSCCKEVYLPLALTRVTSMSLTPRPAA